MTEQALKLARASSLLPAGMMGVTLLCTSAGMFLVNYTKQQTRKYSKMLEELISSIGIVSSSFVVAWMKQTFTDT